MTEKLKKSLENFKKTLDIVRHRDYNENTKFGKPNLIKLKNDEKGVKKMPYDFSRLLGRIKEYGYTQESLANAIGKDKSTLSAKLNNKGEFKAAEIDAICKLLDISNDEIGTYFFCR